MLIVESLGLGVRYFRQTHWYPETVKRSCASSSCHWCKLMPGGVASWVQILPECSAVSSAVLQHVVNDCLWFSEGKPQTINNIRSRFPTWWDYPRAPRAQKKNTSFPGSQKENWGTFNAFNWFMHLNALVIGRALGAMTWQSPRIYPWKTGISSLDPWGEPKLPREMVWHYIGVCGHVNPDIHTTGTLRVEENFRKRWLYRPKLGFKHHNNMCWRISPLTPRKWVTSDMVAAPQLYWEILIGCPPYARFLSSGI